MGERKVLNKYFPPDWDPSLLPKRKRDKEQQIKVRVMLPMSVQCNSCREYIYRGKKFNARKEEAIGEDYLGIKIWRFYIKCTSCSAEIAFKTDPKSSDYICETGAQRNFEPWRQQEVVDAAAVQLKAEEEMGDAMRQLENRTAASKREMEIMDALEEIREKNTRATRLQTDDMIRRLAPDEATRQLHAQQQQDEAEDEAYIEQLFGKKVAAVAKQKNADDQMGVGGSSSSSSSSSMDTSGGSKSSGLAGIGTSFPTLGDNTATTGDTTVPTSTTASTSTSTTTNSAPLPQKKIIKRLNADGSTSIMSSIAMGPLGPCLLDGPHWPATRTTSQYLLISRMKTTPVLMLTNPKHQAQEATVLRRRKRTLMTLNALEESGEKR
jgi:hypothetical protein